MTTLTRALFLAMLLTPSLAFAQGTYTQIDYPGASQTYPQGIDAAGDLVGYYYDAANAVHGFLLSGGLFTTIDYAGGTGTFLYGINDEGLIVGSDGINGLLYDVQSQTFTLINYPTASSTMAAAINNSGTIAGAFSSGSGCSEQNGFELIGTIYRKFDVPESNETYLVGINNIGVIVGGFVRIQNQDCLVHTFISHPGTEAHVFDPKGLLDAGVLAINDLGGIAGFYVNSTSGYYTGFEFENKQFNSIEFPDSIYTVARGINDSEQVVGNFYYPSSPSISHGFLWTPDAPAGKNDSPRSGVRQ